MRRFFIWGAYLDLNRSSGATGREREPAGLAPIRAGARVQERRRPGNPRQDAQSLRNEVRNDSPINFRKANGPKGRMSRIGGQVQVGPIASPYRVRTCFFYTETLPPQKACFFPSVPKLCQRRKHATLTSHNGKIPRSGMSPFAIQSPVTSEPRRAPGLRFDGKPKPSHSFGCVMEGLGRRKSHTKPSLIFLTISGISKIPCISRISSNG